MEAGIPSKQNHGIILNSTDSNDSGSNNHESKIENDNDKNGYYNNSWH